MALLRDLSRAQLAFQVADLDIDEFQVLRYRGQEGLCQLYRFEIDLATTDTGLTMESVVGKAAVLSVNTSGGAKYFHGIIGRFELTGETHDETYFRAELVPAVWLLTHRYGSRIFQNKTVPEIVSAVLTRAGIPGDRVRTSFTGTHDPREYCVQYRETDYNFICRLMEEEGIWWCFEQTQDAHILVLADAAAAYAPIEGEPSLRYMAPTGLNVPEEHVFRFRFGRGVRPGAVVLSDFNFENPKLNLQSKGTGSQDPALEFSDYPGEYTQQAAGTELAKLRAEEFECGRALGIGQSNCPRLAPGLTFELAEHPHQALNGSYLVTSVLHSGKQAVVRTSSGPNGRAGLLDHRLHQSLLTARQDREGTTREFAEALLQLIARLHRGDETAHRVWGQWLYHAGQVLGDLAAVAGALGAKPLEAIAAPGLLEESGRAGRGSLVNDDAPVYECRFECIPAAVTYRPARVSRWPVMRGSQTARVVGPAGEAIHCDKFGRVKVQFHWDREGKHDENSSCWIRVSHGMAGGAYGHLFLPRVGQEVIVDFLEGDPDQPIITGRVYNADHMPAYPLPEEKTKSYIKTHSSKGGGGTNEIRFEDLKDKEQILIHAQKDLHVRVTSDEVETVERDRHLSVGNDKVEQVGRDKSVRVKGKESYQVDGTLSVTCGGDVVEKLSANHKHEVTETYLCKAMSICLDAAQEIELKCGGSSIVLTPAAVFIVGGPLVNIDSGAGPPVSPVSASATAPVEPGTADDVTPGKDTTYSGGEELAEAESPSEVAGWEFEPAETKEKEASWIDISLVNEAAEPIPGARYRVVDSAGKVKEGTLDANGRAHVAPIEPGPCEVSFPDYDGPAWRKGTGSAVRDEPTEAFEEPLPLADDTRCDNVSPRPWEAEQQEATLEAEREAANQDEEGDDSQLP